MKKITLAIETPGLHPWEPLSEAPPILYPSYMQDNAKQQPGETLHDWVLRVNRAFHERYSRLDAAS